MPTFKNDDEHREWWRARKAAAQRERRARLLRVDYYPSADIAKLLVRLAHSQPNFRPYGHVIDSLLRQFLDIVATRKLPE